MKIQGRLAGVCVLLGWGTLAAQTFTLSGTVIDGVSNQPLVGVAVTLATRSGDPLGDPASTDASGRFAFGGLRGGSYFLSAEASFGTVPYGEAADTGKGSAIRVAADQSVVFRILPRGSIEGTVRDEFGDPMEMAGVSIVRSSWQNGGTKTTVLEQRFTDDRGSYRFGNLAPGNYAVCVNGGQAAPAAGPVDFAARGANRAYARACNRTFQLSPGQHTQIDLTPQVGTIATVSGRVRNLPPQSGISLLLTPDEAGVNQNLGAAVDASGAFVIRNVPAGRYRLRASGGSAQGTLTADIPLEVGTSDLSGLDVTLSPAGRVVVVLHGAEEPGKVSALLRGVDTSLQAGGSPERDGLGFGSLAPGRYRLQMTMPPDQCLTSMVIGSREMRGEAFEVAAGVVVRLDVTVTKNCGTIDARAVRGSDAVAGAKVVILASGTPQAPGEIREDVTSEEGTSFSTALAPGQYLVWAWALEGPGAMTGPASLAAVAQQATTVEVTSGKTAQVDVPLLTDEGKGQ